MRETIPLECWTLPKELQAFYRAKELRLIEEVRANQDQCEYPFTDDEVLKSIVPGPCRFNGDNIYEGKKCCDYHLDKFESPDWRDKVMDRIKEMDKELRKFDASEFGGNGSELSEVYKDRGHCFPEI